MAKKRLNKKVALIGSAVFFVLILAVIAVVLHLSRNPQKFIKDGDAAFLAGDYKNAERCYHKARSLAKEDSVRIEMLFKLVDVYIKTDRWDAVPGCWNKIIQIDPQNTKARYELLKYFYIMADSGMRRVWKEVESGASAFMDIADADLLKQDTQKWDADSMAMEGPAERKDGPVARKIGGYLHLVRGRAIYEMAKIGAVIDPNSSLAKAQAELEKAGEFEPDNIEAQWYLAQIILQKGEFLAAKGNIEEKGRAAEEAKKLLEKSVAAAGDSMKANINLLKIKLMMARMGGLERIQALEPEYLSLVKRFGPSAEVYYELAGFYMQLGPKKIDNAMEAIEKAVKLDPEYIAYSMSAADIHYRKSCLSPKQSRQSEMDKAVEIAKGALGLPDAQDNPGPRMLANRNNKVLLNVMLAGYYIEQVLEPDRFAVDTEARKQALLADAEKAVLGIEQIIGSGDDPVVTKWRGMLEFAKGEKSSAIRKLYSAYEQLKGAGRSDGELSYTLAKYFANSSELGASREFFLSALGMLEKVASDRIDEKKPEALLDCADLLLRLRDYEGVLNIVSYFEKKYWANDRSRELRINAAMALGQFDEVEKELAGGNESDPNQLRFHLSLLQVRIDRLRSVIAKKQLADETPGAGLPQGEDESMTAELKGYENAFEELVNKLLAIDPNSVSENNIAAVCKLCIEKGKIEQAGGVVDRFLQHFPDSTTAMYYKKVLADPAAGKLSAEKLDEMQESVFLDLTDPVRRAVNLGLFYQKKNKLQKAAEEFEKVFADSLKADKESKWLSAINLSGIAIATKDSKLAERMADFGRRDNLDECGGKFYAAVAAVVSEKHKEALLILDDCLKQRPVFSAGYMFRSRANSMLDNEQMAIQDAKKAADLNPTDGAVAEWLARLLYQRNAKLGINVTAQQRSEARDALIRAIRLNPEQWQLQSIYAEYVSEENPANALAIRQYLQKSYPSVENALLLGNMAARMATREVNADRKKVLFEIAASSFEQARSLDPNNKDVLKGYAEYYRVTGQMEKAEQLLSKSQDMELQWGYYYRSGKYEKAGEVLGQLYKQNPKNIDTVKGLLLVSQKARDKTAAVRYSAELLVLEDSVDNRLVQIQTFLELGLVKEAENKLQSFREKHPDEPRAIMLEAWLVMSQGRLKKASELANRALEADQNSAVGWRLRGEINRLMANYEQSIIDLAKSKSLADEPETRIALAKSYMRAGRDEEAITELKNTISNPLASQEACFLLEQIYSRLERKDALGKFYDELLSKTPTVLWTNRAAAFAAAMKDFAKAERLYGIAWQESKKQGTPDTTALEGYLTALQMGGKPDKVFEEAGKYVDSDFAPLAFSKMAEVKLSMSDKESAIKYCRKAIEQAGKNENLASDMLQRMYSLLGADEVSKICREILDANPKSLPANLAMFSLAKIGGEYNKAIEYIDKCLEIAGSDDAARVNYIMRKTDVLMMAYNKTSDANYLNKAIAEHESLLAKMPNNISILNNIAYILAENDERPADALKYAKRASEEMPNNPVILDTYSYALYRNGKYSEAAESLNAALQLYERAKDSVPPEIYEHLGMIKEKLGLTKDAITAYNQALEAAKGAAATNINSKRVKAAVERLSRQ